VVILGQMGAGKTTVGRLVAAALGWPFRDNDDALESRAGRTAAQVQAEQGVDALHDLERRLFEELLADDDRTVIAAPGSVVLAVGRAELRDRAFVVWLQVSPAVLADRVAAGGPPRRGCRRAEPGRGRRRGAASTQAWHRPGSG
jgi:shikimate kinase